MPSEYEEHRAFEDEARRVAEAVWGMAPGDCQPEHYSDNPVIRELDGIARLRDITHLVMATVSTKLEKVKEDVRKLEAAERIEQQRGLPVSKWLITRWQLEAPHQKAAKDRGVKLLTLDNFRQRFFDGRAYVQKRRVAAFGSARNLADGTISISENEYVPLPILASNLSASLVRSVGTDVVATSVSEIASGLARGEIFVLVGPFGAGKSLTTREVFLSLTRLYDGDAQYPVPLAINLREHWGALYGDEILERHARSIGFAPREDLVAAWRAGIACLLLDGFDEMAAQVVAEPGDRNFMRAARAQALQPVRDLIGKMPSGVGALICGRDHYFDDPNELVHALGLTGKRFQLLRLGEFTEEQAIVFLRRHQVPGTLPDWLPRKPLLLGYLAHRALLPEVLKIDGSSGFGHTWDQFLTLICEREATHERVVMEPITLRRVLERLACGVRATSSGVGPIRSHELAEAYRVETGQAPGEGVLMQLQRLPGLTAREQDPGARSFIDEDVLAALQGSAVARFVLEGADWRESLRWLSHLADKGVAMAAHLVETAGADAASVVAAALRAMRGASEAPYRAQLAADCAMVALEMSRESGSADLLGLALDEISFGELDLEELRVENLTIKNSMIEGVVLGARSSSAVLRDCLIARVSGVASEKGLPRGMFEGCQIQAFDDMSTNAAVIRSDLEPPLKCLLTILRKLYLQAGGGRKIGAFDRGLPPGPIQDSVPEVLRILGAEGVIHVQSGIAHPIRRQTSRIMQILSETRLSRDPIVERVKRVRPR
jgi:hypothetical protein